MQTYEDEPEIVVGDRLLLFLLPDEYNIDLPAASFIIAGHQGFWAVDDQGRAGNVRYYREHHATPVEELAETIREILRQPEPEYFDLVPLEEAPIVEAE
jgi:hypothetical protein